MKNSVVCVALVNWNGFDDSREAIESFLKFQKLGQVLLLVDNGSTDNSLGRLRECFGSQIEYLALESNTGITGGTNAAFKWSVQRGFKYTIVGNNDIIFNSESVSALVDRADTNEKIGIVGSKIFRGLTSEYYYSTGGTKFWGINYGLRAFWMPTWLRKFDKPERIKWNTGTFVLYRNEMVKDINGMDDNLFLIFEDIEYGYRAGKKDWQVWYEPKSVIWHKVSKSRGVISRVNQYYLVRNTVYLGKKGMWRGLYVIWLIPLMLMIMFINPIVGKKPSLFKWSILGLIDGFKNKMGKTNRF